MVGMYVYAGIDEAGYGPMLGPLTVARTVFTLDRHDPDTGPPDLWALLSGTVCRTLSKRRGRIPVNDSKKLTTKAAGVKHLEHGCLSFNGFAGRQAAHVNDYLTALGESCHEDLAALPWYAPTEGRPWQELPTTHTAGELAVSRSMLAKDAQRQGVRLADLGVAVVFEDRFNHMVAATRSKAAVSFAFVAAHLQHIWEHFGNRHAHVAVDRQGGRTSYRDLLQQNFPAVELTVLGESATRSAYRLVGAGRQMTVTFQTNADGGHLPTALASMTAKYTRELLMARFNAFFQHQVPSLKPTAGYATDARRWLDDMRPHWRALGLSPDRVRRLA